MNERELENYCFFRIYSMDFDEVRQSVIALKKIQDKGVRYRLLREIAVSYSRPFSDNRGKIFSKHRCPERFIPKKFLELHKELFRLRNERFAHSDLTRYNPRVSQLKGFPMSFRGFNYEHLDKRVSEIESLVRDVAENLQKEITRNEARLVTALVG